jgi:hypothetical protein
MGLRAIFVLLTLSGTLSAQVVLFDGNLGSTPSAQGWPFIGNPPTTHSVTQVASPGFTTVDSRNPITDQGGYFSEDPIFGIFTHPNMPITDRSVGYTVRFDVRVAHESHVLGPAGDDNGDGLEDRAGFSVISISEDLEGVEIAFWQDRIWVQDDDSQSPSDLFTQAEGTSFDTTAAILQYELRVLDSLYQFVPGGGVAPLLQGPLRNYTNFAGSIDPYEIPSFLFFGDDTTRAEAEFEIARIEVDAVSPATVDADALVAAIVAGTDPPFFDLTGDAQVDAADLSAWLAVAGAFHLGGGRAFLAGDANLDGIVDGLDFISWNNHKFTFTAAWSAGDFNADGVVDGLDFVIWNGNKFQSSDGVMRVPEPALWSWWVIGSLAGLIQTQRRSPLPPPASAVI